MSRIKRRRIVVADNANEEEEVFYCPNCELHGFRQKLGVKIIPLGEEKPADWDQWKSCHECGHTYALHQLKKEARVGPFAEQKDPTNEKGYFSGINNKRKLSPREKEMQVLRDRIDEELDEDIRRELKKGNTVNIISEDNMPDSEDDSDYYHPRLNKRVFDIVDED